MWLFALGRGEAVLERVDLRRIPAAVWRARGWRPGFQDFAKLELLARETVGVGNLPDIDDGLELSGGHWQKLALGRAMMREHPLLLILDEPTAALDAGGIIVLVSHRFSTVRMADLIVVVDAGGFTEMGSHDELMAVGGAYTELYELQARAYR